MLAVWEQNSSGRYIVKLLLHSNVYNWEVFQVRAGKGETFT